MGDKESREGVSGRRRVGAPDRRQARRAVRLQRADRRGPDSAVPGDVLTLTVSYSGCCARHDFTLVADNQFQESGPVLLNVHLAHEAHDDPCEAYPTNRYEFDLTPVKRLCQDAYGQNEGVIVIRLMGPAPSWRFPNSGYSFAVTYAFE